MLRAFLDHLEHDPAAVQLADEGGSAFVSQSLRPFVVAALADRDAKRPALIVVGDDRAARDLAADLKAWLNPRPVRYYPSRGVAYESHLTPPPHLVGLRVAALDALTDTAEGSEQPVVVISATALSEKVPDPKLRPHGFMLRVGDLIDLEEVALDLVAAGYQRTDQVEERGQFAIRGGLLDVYPATEERAVRVDLFDIEIEALRWFSTFTQRSLGETECVEISPAAELAPEHREMAEIAAADAPEDRPDIAELLPVDHFKALLDLIPEHTQIIVAADEDVEPTLRDHWEDVCTAFDDQDARDLYVSPTKINEALAERASARLSSISGDQPIEIRAQAADFAARNMHEAESELEKLVRSDYTTVVAWPQIGAAERAAYNLDRIKASLNGARKGLIFTEASLRDGFVAPGLKLAAFPEHRLIHRKKASTRPTRKGRGLLRSFTDLRTGDFIVHEDHGVARFAGFDTKTVAGTTRDYLNLEFQGDDKVFMPVDQLAKISRYLGADGGAPTLSKLGGTRWDKIKARARRAAQELAGELLNLYAERKRRRGHAFPEFSEELRDLEANFPYRETPDQRDAIDNVIADMESERPMDRLICGDVGYGKTEVALRAAVKAAIRRQAGADARPDDDPRPAALRHVRGAPARPAVRGRARLALPLRRRAARRRQALRRGQDRHPDRHAPPALARRAREGARPAGRRRGAALRRQAEGADASAQAQGRRDLDERDADPENPPDVSGRAARHQRDRDAARGAPAGQDLRRRVRRAARQAGAGARDRARGPGVLPAQPRRRHRGDGRAAAQPLPEDALHRRARADGREDARGAHDGVPARRGGRAGLHERSSSPASTSRRPTR